MKTLSDKQVLVRVEFGRSDTTFGNIKCAGLMVHIDYIKESVRQLNRLRGTILRRIKMEEHCDNCEKGYECDTCKPHFDSIRKSFDNGIKKIYGDELLQLGERSNG